MLDYHIHTALCGHACGTLEAYVQAARECGLEEMGFADHLPMLKWWRPEYSMRPEQLPGYVREVQTIQRAFPEIRIKLGIEADYYSQAEEAATRALLKQHSFDYVYGSVHFLDEWAFDNPERLAEWETQDVDRVYERYFTLVQQAAQSGLFDILSHLDLVKKFGHRPTYAMQDLVEPVLNACQGTGTAIEVNTSGWRKPVKEVYPSPEILRMIHQADVPIVLGSDAHAPHEVAADFNRARLWLREIGFTNVVVFKQREIVGVLPL